MYTVNEPRNIERPVFTGVIYKDVSKQAIAKVIYIRTGWQYYSSYQEYNHAYHPKVCLEKETVLII